jgi:4-oxalocrotonate tautomerase
VGKPAADGCKGISCAGVWRILGLHGNPSALCDCRGHSYRLCHSPSHLAEHRPQGESLSTKGNKMPLVRIDLIEGKPPEYGARIGRVVYRAQVEVLGAPKDDLFQVITEHTPAGLQFDRDYLGIHRTDDCIFLQITLNEGRTVELKRQFYKAVADGLHQELGVRREDVFVSLVEVKKENWSYGNGEAQYAMG